MRKTNVIQIRVTDRQKATIKEHAESRRLTVSDYLLKLDKDEQKRQQGADNGQK